MAPHTKEIIEYLKAREVFDLLVRKAWESGDPGIIFIDRINRDNPNPDQGEIESTNPCGEQPCCPTRHATSGPSIWPVLSCRRTKAWKWTGTGCAKSCI